MRMVENGAAIPLLPQTSSWCDSGFIRQRDKFVFYRGSKGTGEGVNRQHLWPLMDFQILQKQSFLTRWVSTNFSRSTMHHGLARCGDKQQCIPAATVPAPRLVCGSGLGRGCITNAPNRLSRKSGTFRRREWTCLINTRNCFLIAVSLQSVLNTCNKIPLWSSGQSSWLQIQRPEFDSRHYQKSSGSGTGSTQPREYNWGATW
jgi:hypothetical protein